MTSRRSGRPPERAGGDALAALRLVTAALADRKALDPMVLDLRGLTAAADYFVIVSGTSDAHVRGMAEHLMEAHVGVRRARNDDEVVGRGGLLRHRFGHVGRPRAGHGGAPHGSAGAAWRRAAS